MNDMTFLGLGYIGAGLGAGLVLIGAALGIGKLAAAALEGTARQPEAGPALRTTMIIAAALIEGLAFFGLVILAYLWQGLSDATLKGAVVAYLLVIVAMAWRAAVRTQSPAVPGAGALAAAAGACLFLASDSILAVDRFRRPFRAAEPVVFATYWAAQLLIALSVLG